MREKRGINVAFLFIVCLLQFPIRIQTCTFITYIGIYLLPGLYLVVNFKWLIEFLNRILKAHFNSFVVFCFLLIVSFFWPLIYGTMDFSFLFDWWFKLCLLLLKNVFLLAFYENHVANNKKTSFEEYVKYYLYAVALYVSFSLLLVFVDDLRDVCVRYLYFTPKERNDVFNPSYHTRIGWSGWAGFDVTMQCAVAVMLAMMLIIKNQNEFKRQMHYLILTVFALVGTMLYGRTGLLVSLLIIGVTVVYSVINKQWKFVLFCVGVGVCGTLILLFISILVPTTKVWFDWAFSFIVNFVTKGTVDDGIGSARHLIEDMYWIPSVKTLLFGDAYYTQEGHYYMRTDAGFMRLTLYYGFVNYILGLLASFVFMNMICKRLNNECCTSAKYRGFVFTFLLGICVLAFELKGEAYYKIMAIVLPMALLNPFPEKEKLNSCSVRELLTTLKKNVAFVRKDRFQ